ncbi:MAG: hypothetical protein IKD04_03850 [Clostridia bacterium]|nr:hypothetical protein [Clostridia bacterium]
MLKRFLALSLAMLVFISCPTVFAEKGTETAFETNVNAKSTFEITVNDEEGTFTVSDSLNDCVWNSYPSNLEESGMKKSGREQAKSALVINVFDTSAKTLSITAYSKSDASVTAEINGEATKLIYNFEQYGITVPLRISATKDGFCASINCKDIVETDKNYKLVNIELLPYFNAGYYEEKGYMLLPDGSGAIVDFNNGKGENSNYSQDLYGRDYGIDLQYSKAKTENLPIGYFGIVHENSYSASLIINGTANANITAYGNNKNNPYNRIYPVVAVRKADMFINSGSWQDVPVYQDSVAKDTVFEVQYLLRKKDTATYSDLATCLREYMVDNNLIAPSELRSHLQIDIVGATVKKKPLIGIPVNRSQELTNFNEATEIVKTLNNGNCQNVLYRYINWNAATAWGKQKASSKLSLLGGNQKFSVLKDTIASTDGMLFLTFNSNMVYKGKNIFSYFTDFSQSIFGEPIKLYKYNLNNYTKNKDYRAAYTLRNDKIGATVNSWCEKINKLDVEGVSAATSEMVYTDFKNEGASRTHTEAYIKEALSGIKMPLIVDNGNYYTLSSASFISNTPASSNGFDISDDSIPFYQMLIHGLIPYSISPINAYPDYNTSFLRAVETGSTLHFVLCSAEKNEIANSEMSDLIYCDSRSWSETIIEMSDRYSEVYSEICNDLIIDHERLCEDVFATHYESGITIIVNYSEDDVMLDNNETVPAKSFITLQKN